MNSHNSKLLHTLGNKEEKLSAFLYTGQRNKGEERGEENYQKKRGKKKSHPYSSHEHPKSGKNF